MNTASTSTRGLAGRLGRGTAILVAAAATINGGVDLYKAVLNVPTNIYDRTNQELFRTHFGAVPRLAQPFEIKSSAGTVNMILHVYDSGDIFVRYGEFQQWLPFRKPRVVGASLFPQAHAQVPGPASIPPAPSQIGGTAAPIRIDTRSGMFSVPTGATASDSEKVISFSQVLKAHDSLHRTTETFEKVFPADPGYKFTQFDLQLGSANNSRIDEVVLVDKGASIRVRFALTSGPFYDRYRGWINGTIRAKQEPVR